MKQSASIIAMSLALLALAACSANEAEPAARVDAAADADAAAAQSRIAMTATATSEPPVETGYEAACTDKITAKMPDPSAANVTYAPLSGDEGYKAVVTVRTQNGDADLRFDYTCTRTASGDIVTNIIAD